MLETVVENTLKRECKKRGALCIKSETLAKGFPDRMVLAFPGKVAFPELKRVGTKREPAQRVWWRKLLKLGFDSPQLNTPAEVRQWAQEFLG